MDAWDQPTGGSDAENGIIEPSDSAHNATTIYS